MVEAIGQIGASHIVFLPENCIFWSGTTLAVLSLEFGKPLVKSDTPTSHRSPIFYEILASLADHPQAQDAMEGIVEWWLLEQRTKREATQVKAALKQLTADNYVIARTGKTGRVYYRVNRQKLGEIRRLISKEF